MSAGLQVYNSLECKEANLNAAEYKCAELLDLMTQEGLEDKFRTCGYVFEDSTTFWEWDACCLQEGSLTFASCNKGIRIMLPTVALLLRHK